MRLIDPNEIYFAACRIDPTYSGKSAYYEHVAFQQDVDQIKRIEVEPVKHAHWFTLDPNQRTGKAYKFVCSNCERGVFTPRQESINELGYVFCPHCGAKMEENTDEQMDKV